MPKNSLRLGGVAPVSLRLGTTPVSRAYLGGTLVYDVSGSSEDPDNPLGEWPNATNSGYLGDMAALTSASGAYITASGTVVQNYLVSGRISVDAADVTISNCVINADWYGVITYEGCNNLIIEDCTIIGGLNCGILIQGNTNITIRRCHLYNGEDGMKISGTNVTVSDCYIHDLAHQEGSHNDGIQCASGSGFTIYNNWIESNDTSCIAMFEDQGVWDDVRIENNRLIGGAYPLYAGGADATNTRVINNVFSGWSYGPVTSWSPTNAGNLWSGNTDSNSNPITP